MYSVGAHRTETMEIASHPVFLPKPLNGRKKAPAFLRQDKITCATGAERGSPSTCSTANSSEQRWEDLGAHKEIARHVVSKGY